MSITNRLQKTILLGGETFSQSIASTGEIVIAQNHNIPAAVPVEFVSRTSATELTIKPPPELAVDGAWFDVWWAGGSRKRTGSTKDGNNDFRLGGGSGDEYPEEPTEYMVRHSYFSSLQFISNKILAIFLSSTENGKFHFAQNTGNFTQGQEKFVIEVGKNYLYDWQRGSGILPSYYFINYGINKIYLTPNKNAATMKIGILLPK